MSGSDGGADAGGAREGAFAAGDGGVPGRRRAAAAAVLGVVAAAWVAGCAAASGQPPAGRAGAAASAGPAGNIHPSARAALGSTSRPAARPPAGLGPDVTLAYFQHGVGLVGVAPFGGGWQGYEPSTLWLSAGPGRWRDVTPPGARSGKAGDYPFFAAASFPDAATGWVTTRDAATGTVTVYGTRDGGASWAVIGHGAQAAGAGAADLIQLRTPRAAFSEVLEPAGPRMDLRVTADGGRSWRTLYTGPPPRQPGSPLADPLEMPMVFISASRGFAADGISPADIAREGAGQGDFFATSDGGRDWVRESPPLAGPSSACAAPPGGATSCLFGLPVFTGAARGVLPSEVLTGTSATVGFATTTDGGGSWTLAATLHVPLARRSLAAVPPAGDALTAVPSAGTWWVLAAARHGVTTWVTTSSGHAWSASSGAVPGTPRTLQAASASHAWLTTQAGGSRRLYVTTDAGRSWHEVHPG